MDTNANPLANFFRQPAIYIKLPSKGEFWKDGTLELPVTGEIPIYPMTTSDEITLRTPDALLNGVGVVQVIQSCCPSIKDAWSMPSIDVDATLIAIRIASYGSDMDIDTKCPHCTEENTYQVDLNTVLNTVVSPNYSAPVKFNSLEISLKPQPYFSVNKTNTINFEEQRILATINDESLADDVKSAKFNEHLQRLVSLNMDIMVDSTHSIKTPDNLIVADPTFIREFYQKADRKVVKEVRAWLEKAAAESAIKPVSVVCDDCKKAFDLSITFDYAHFFA